MMYITSFSYQLICFFSFNRFFSRHNFKIAKYSSEGENSYEKILSLRQDFLYPRQQLDTALYKSVTTKKQYHNTLISTPPNRLIQSWFRFTIRSCIHSHTAPFKSCTAKTTDILSLLILYAGTRISGLMEVDATLLTERASLIA